VLHLEGALRYPVARALRAFVDGTLATTDADAFLVDLRATTFVDSTGLGLLARVARQSLSRCGRRAVLVCPENDVAVTLRSAGFDELCAMVEDSPLDAPPTLEEIPLPIDAGDGGALGRVILEAHRDLSALSTRNREEYAAVIAALEADLARARAAR
jgi:anti-anti-sigma factor